jgi:hypothetical protein
VCILRKSAASFAVWSGVSRRRGNLAAVIRKILDCSKTCLAASKRGKKQWSSSTGDLGAARIKGSGTNFVKPFYRKAVEHERTGATVSPAAK